MRSIENYQVRSAIDKDPEYQPEQVEHLPEMEVLYQQKKHDDLSFDDRYADDVQRVQQLQQQWNSTLGIVPTRKELLRNHNPVFSRFNYETATSEQEREAVMKHELKMMEAGLRERYRANGFSTYIVDTDGKLRNDIWLQEPFEEVIKRGIAVRAENGSDEQEREISELLGFRQIQKTLTDPAIPNGTTMVSLSPPSEKFETPYKDKYVDRYQKIENAVTGEVEIRLNRLVKEWTHEQYKTIAEQLQSGYFADYSREESLDSYLLSRPILLPPQNAGEILDEILSQYDLENNKLAEHQMQEIITIGLPYILEYIRALTRKEFDPVSIAKEFNTIYNKTDTAYNLQKQGRSEELLLFAASERSMSYADRVDERAYWGVQSAQMINAACGFSGGFAINSGASMSAASSPFIGGVAQFGMPGSRPEDDPNLCRCEGAKSHFHCPGEKTIKVKTEDGETKRKKVACNYKITVGLGISSCPDCGESKKC